MSRKHSPIWSYFKVCGDSKFATCKECKEQVSRGGNSTKSYNTINLTYYLSQVLVILKILLNIRLVIGISYYWVFYIGYQYISKKSYWCILIKKMKNIYKDYIVHVHACKSWDQLSLHLHDNKLCCITCTYVTRINGCILLVIFTHGLK